MYLDWRSWLVGVTWQNAGALPHCYIRIGPLALGWWKAYLRDEAPDIWNAVHDPYYTILDDADSPDE
jgi:hypothetical protein